MAQTADDIILNIEISYQDAINGIAQYTQKIDELKKQQADLKKSLDNGSISQNEYNKSVASSKIAIDQNKNAIRALETEIKNNIKIGNEQNGSISSMKAELSNLTKQYDNLSQAERSNANVGGEMLKNIKLLSENLRYAEEETGRFQRSVGNYASAGEELKKRLKELKNEMIGLAAAGAKNSEEYQKLAAEAQKLTAISKRQNQTTTQITNTLSGLTGAYGAYKSVLAATGMETEKLDKVMSELAIVITALASFEGLNKMLNSTTFGMKANTAATKAATVIQGIFTTSVNTTSTAFKVLRGAIISTGIGALIVGVGLLVSNFDKLAAVFKKGEDGMSSFGKAFAKIKEIAMGVWEVLKTYIMTPLRAIGKILSGDFKGAFNEIKNGFDVVGNYQKGANAQMIKNQEAAAKAKVEAEKRALGKKLLNSAAALEKQLEIDKAAGLSAKKLYDKEMAILEQKKRGYEESLKYIADKNSEQYKEMLKNIDDTNHQIAVKNATETKRQADEIKKRADELTAARKEAAAKELQAIQQLEDALRGQIKDNVEKQIADEKTATARQIAEIKNRLETEKNLTIKAKENLQQLILELQKNSDAKIAEIQTQASEETIQKQIAEEQKRISLLLEIAVKGSENERDLKLQQIALLREQEIKEAEKTGADVAAITEKYRQQEVEANKIFLQKKYDEQRKIAENEFAARALEIQQSEDAAVNAAALELERARSEQAALLAMDAETKAAKYQTDADYAASVIANRERIMNAEKAVNKTQAENVVLKFSKFIKYNLVSMHRKDNIFLGNMYGIHIFLYVLNLFLIIQH